MSDPIITFDHVVKEFKTRGRGANIARAVDDVSLTIDRGDIFGIIGYSGAGKSTLVRLINALERPTSGTVTVLGTDITSLSETKLRPIRQKIGMIFQQFNLFSTKTVAQNIAYPLQLDHWRKDYQDRRVNELLEFVGLSEHANKYPSQLSGGQKQRVGIARALATNPEILLADEATSALDPQSTQSILGLIRDIHDRLGITVIVITHQMSVVEQICTRVAILDGGEVAEEGKVSEVFAAPQSQAAKRLVYPEGYEQPVVRFDEGKMLRVVFNGAKATKTPLIAQMALDCGITASILGASTKGIGEKAYGNMLLGIPGGDAELQRAMDYLRSIPDIFVEEVDGHV